MAWSIEQELCEIVGCDDLPVAVRRLNLVSAVATSLGIKEIRDWHRAGAETYQYHFEVSNQSRKTLCVLKACAAWSPVKSLEQILTDWIDRRLLLKARRIQLPLLYGWGHGVLLEEHIPYRLSDIIGAGHPNSFLPEIARVAGVLSSLRFAPIEPFQDLRSRGRDVVMIDFGEDLGPPGLSQDALDAATLFDRLLTTLRAWDIPLSYRQRQLIAACYNAEIENPSTTH